MANFKMDTETKKRKIDPNVPKSERFREGVKIWVSFYRANIHRFAKDYMGLDLHLYQLIILYLMNHITFFMYIAARGQGKSFIIAVFCVARCILYPNTKVVIASGTKGQARLIITEKVMDLMRESPMVNREIKEVKTGANDTQAIFHNGSKIFAVVSNDNARGFRGNILIVDEFRLVSKDIVDKVLRPFLNVTRQPPYLKKPEYSHLAEENKEIYISSAWYKNHWIWDSLKAFRTSMLKGKSYFCCALPYQLSVYHGLLSEARVEQLKSEDDFDPITWYMESDCMFFGESENAFYKLDDIQGCRNLKRPSYPLTDIEYLEQKNSNRKRKSDKQKGEIRILSVDVAMMSGNENDATVFTYMRLIPDGNSYIRYVPYIETLVGQHSEKQSIRLKQLFYDFECDMAVMDTMGNGISIFDDCSRILYDEERDEEYPAWTAVNDEKMSSRVFNRNALPFIYSIKGTKQINHEIAVGLRNNLQRRKLKLLQNELNGKDFLSNNKKLGYGNKSEEDKAKLLRPYIQTTALSNELVNLEYESVGGYIKIKEVGSNRKDRYSSLAYGNYYADMLEKKTKKEEIDDDDELIYY